MVQIDAVFQQGVFKPLQPVDFAEDQRVHLIVETARQETPMEWMERVRKRSEAIAEREGTFPDSAREIALDRQR